MAGVGVQKTEDTDTVYALPERRRGRRCFRLAAAAVCLGLLCVLLMSTIILRHMYHVYLKEEKDNLTKERDQLKISNQNLTEERDQLKISNQNLTKERDQLKISNQNLTEERDQLKISNQNLTEERDQLKISNQNLAKERDQLKKKNSCRKLTEDSTLQTGSGDSDQSPGVKRCMKSGSCYLFVYGLRTWEDSRRDCRERGAHLVIINSEEEQKFLYDVSGSSVFWIGLSDTEREGIWKWVDGSVQAGSRYWMPGEPNNYGRNKEEENCAGFVSSDERFSTFQKWNDMNCSFKRFWVCELKPADQ